MSELNEIVGAILTEITEAQHQSNLYSVFLVNKYEEKEHGLADLPIPNAVIKEVELELNYGVIREHSELLDAKVDLKELKEVLIDYAKKSTAIVVKKLQDFFGEEAQRKSDDDSLLDTLDDDIVKINTIKQNMGLPHFFNYAAQYLYNTLWGQKETLINEQKKLSRKAIFKLVVETIEKVFLDHPDLNSIIAIDKNQREKIKSLCDSEIKEFFMNQNMPSFNVDKQQKKNRIEVIVETDKLEKLPSGIINSIKIKAELRNFRLEIAKESEDHDYHNTHNSQTKHLIPSHY